MTEETTTRWARKGTIHDYVVWFDESREIWQISKGAQPSENDGGYRLLEPLLRMKNLHVNDLTMDDEVKPSMGGGSI